jgi:hypothetical protein
MTGSAGADPAGIELPGAPRLSEREVVQRLRDEAPPAVLVVGSVSASLLRELRAHPPALLAVCGSATSEQWRALGAIPGLALLGPEAVVKRGSGHGLAVAIHGAELAGLERALRAQTPPTLAIAPTPSWLRVWLREPSAPRTVGTIQADLLDRAWLEIAAELAQRHLLVPVGVPRLAAQGAPAESALIAAAAAATLERWTGPVFPAPRLLAKLAEHGAGATHEPRRAEREAPGRDALALWDQARRALPGLGDAAGMEAPSWELSLEVPTTSFLAQATLLRRAQRRAIHDAASHSEGPVPAVDAEGVARAREVLAGAGAVLSDQESKVVLRGFGLAVTRQAVASSATGAAHFAERIGFPVVMKAVGPDLRRKTEIGAVVLNVDSAAEARRAYVAITRAVEQRAPTARLDGVLVAEQVEEGTDVHCGILRLTTGELLLTARGLAAPREPIVLPVPVTAGDAALAAHAILAAAGGPHRRSDDDAERSALASALLALTSLAHATGPRLRTVDVTPLRLWGTPPRATILDARISQPPHLQGT